MLLKVNEKLEEASMVQFMSKFDKSPFVLPEFCTLLGLEASGNKTGMFRAIQERVYYLYREKKQPLVLAIDEARHLNYNILRDLKMLLNHSYDS